MPKERVTCTHAFLRWRTSLVSRFREKTENLAAQCIPAAWSMSRDYHKITLEAKRLGMNARERGEVRFRAGLFSRGAARVFCSPDCCTANGLLELFSEEVEGCRQWTRTRHAGEISFSSSSSFSFLTLCDEVSTSDSDGETFAAADILEKAASSVSAVLNHLRPMQWALCTMEIFSRTEKGFDNSDRALGLVRRLMIESVPVEIVISLAPFVFNLISCDDLRGEWAEEIDKWCQDRVEDPLHKKLRKTIYSVQHSLGRDTDVFPCQPLYEKSEAELLAVRQRITKELAWRRHLDAQAKQKSAEASLCFRQASDAYREICADKTIRNEVKRRAPHAKGILKTNSNVPALCCWRRAVLTEWKARRTNVLFVLQSSLVSDDKWDQQERERERTDALLAPHARRLCAMVEVNCASFTSASLLEEMLPRAKNEEEKFSAVELIVFLMASRNTNVLDELEGFLRIVRENEAVEMALRIISENMLAHLVDVIFRHIFPSTQNERRRKKKNGSDNIVNPSATLRDAKKQECAVFDFNSSSSKEEKNGGVCQGAPCRASPELSLLFSPLAECLVRVQSARLFFHAASFLCPFPAALRCHFFSFFAPPAALPPPFLFALTECFAHALLDALREPPPPPLSSSSSSLPPSSLPPSSLPSSSLPSSSSSSSLSLSSSSSSVPLPRWLRGALWRGFLPLAAAALRHRPAAPRAVRRCHALALALAERWDRRVAPARRAWRRRQRGQREGGREREGERERQRQREGEREGEGKGKGERRGEREGERGEGEPHAAALFALSEWCAEYDADAVVARRVVAFAVLLDAVLGAATKSLLHNAETFSRTCTAVGIVVPDIDNRASQRILSRLLSLAPDDSVMDTEAHASVLRCLSLMRHGCSLWSEALSHYERALVSQQSRPRAHVMHFTIICVLRCVGDAPIARVWRCALTMRVIAAARAAGNELGVSVLAACLHNFTARMHTSCSGANEMFCGAPWCDALEWYNDAIARDAPTSREVLRDLPQLQIACLRAMLAQGEWQRALCLPPLPKPFTAEKRRVQLLRRICESDRTQSCAASLQALLQFGSLKDGEKLQSREHFTTCGKEGKGAADARDFGISGDPDALPLFRSAPPFVPPVSFLCEREGMISLRYILHERQIRELPLSSRVRERVSRAFPLMHVVNPAEGIEREKARAQMDTCYANVLLPIRRLARVRAERQRDAQRRRTPNYVPICK